MRYLLLAIILTGCSQSPKFAVGDCIVGTGVRESWQQPERVEKIIAVGKENYLYEFTGRYGKIRNDFPIILMDNIETKVKCPKELE